MKKLLIALLLAPALAFSADIVQVTAVDTLPSVVGGAMAAGQMIRGASSKIVLVTKVPANAQSGIINSIKIQMDSTIAPADILVLALRDTAGVTATLTPHHQTAQLKDPVSEFLIGSFRTSFWTLGATANGATKSVAEIRNELQGFTLYNDVKPGQNIYWLLIADGAFTLKSKGVIKLTARFLIK